MESEQPEQGPRGDARTGPRVRTPHGGPLPQNGQLLRRNRKTDTEHYMTRKGNEERNSKGGGERVMNRDENSGWVRGWGKGEEITSNSLNTYPSRGVEIERT